MLCAARERHNDICSQLRALLTHRPTPRTCAPHCHRPQLSWIVGVLLLAAAVVVPHAQAGPWIAPGNPQLRHHLQLLADHGYLKIPLTTWPLAWGDVMGAMRRPGPDATPAVHAAFRAVTRSARAAKRGGLDRKLKLQAASTAPLYRDFGQGAREQFESQAELEVTGNRWAARLSVTAVADPSDDEAVRLDGSYIGAALGNWMVVAGAMDRWWGPAWEGGAILGHNARPVPAVVIQRNRSEAFELPVLRWFGPWTMTLFNGWLEEDRDYSRVMLFGMRVAFKPTQYLEVGLSRTAQWGGEGRPDGLDTAVDMLLGRDNFGDGDITITNQPGNQLAGGDVRLASPWPAVPAAIYAEVIGEDEAGSLPSRYLFTSGIETWGAWSEQVPFRFVLEYNKTRASGHYDYAYNHHVYTDGYRHYGRSMGHGADNDAELISAHLNLFGAWGSRTGLRLVAGELNENGVGQHGFLNGAADLRMIELQQSWTLRGAELAVQLGWTELTGAEVRSDFEDGLRVATRWSRFW